jgi:hypothetical protein
MGDTEVFSQLIGSIFSGCMIWNEQGGRDPV